MKALRTRAAALALTVLVACASGNDEAAKGRQAVVSRDEPTSKDARVALDSGITERTATEAFWVGTSDGYRIEWTADDIVVDRSGGSAAGAPGDRVLSVRSALDSAMRSSVELLATDDTSGEICEDEQDLRIISVVGSIMSLQRNEYFNCSGAAHPSLFASFVAIDLSRTGNEDVAPIEGPGALGHEISLSDLFPDEEILAALLHDRLVQRRIEELRGKTIRPRTTAELVGLLEGGNECEYAFDRDMLRHFAFDHIEGDRVAVRIGLSHGCEAARGRLTQIGILLKIPQSMRAQFDSAASGTHGVLMREARNRFGDASTHVAYRYRFDEIESGSE